MPQQVNVVEPVIGIRLVLTSSLQIESSIPLKAQSVVLEESLITLYKAICSYSAGKSPGHASRCHEVIQAQCLDDDTEQAQLLGVLGGDVSAVRSATGAGLCDTSFLYPVTVAVSAKCSDNLGLWMRQSYDRIPRKYF